MTGCHILKRKVLMTSAEATEQYKNNRSSVARNRRRGIGNLLCALGIVATCVISGPAIAAIGFVQANYAVPQTPQSSVVVPILKAQGAGNLNVVVVGWNDTAAAIASVADAKGNVYTRAVGPTAQTGQLSQAIYYARNILAAAANTNSVTVQFTVPAVYPDIRVLEYAGLDPVNPVDVTAAAAGISSSSSSGAVTTTNANDLIFGANTVATGTVAPGAGYTQRMVTIPDGDNAEDQVVTVVGSYSASAALFPSGPWVMQLVAFKAAGAVTDTTPPTAPATLTAAPAGGNGINLTWVASTDNVGVANYRVERCQGVACINFAQIATPIGATFADTGLLPGTSYSYRVRAADAAGNLSGYSNTATATTASDATPPTAPASLVTALAGTNGVNLTWTASTDNVAVTGYRVERCQGAACISFAQIGTPAATSFADTGLLLGTSYSYRVRAADAAGNLSAYSNVSSVTTAADAVAPSAPTSLVATLAGSNGATLTWTASTDNIGVSGYRVERCQGAGCATFAQVSAPSGTTFSDAGLLAGTSYSYRVRAADAAGNLSGYSNVAAVSTVIVDTTAPSAPANLATVAVGSSGISLTWSASTDNIAVTGYRVERCQGSGCTTFAQIATPSGTAFSDTGLLSGTTYTYRARAADAAGNLSVYSNVSAAATTQVTAGPISFVQLNYAVPRGPQTSAPVTFSKAQAAGNLNIVVVGWTDTTATVNSVTDSAGNAYALAVGPTVLAGQMSQSIYYAKNIAAAAANTITVQFTLPTDHVDVRALEYSGLDPVNPLDATSAGVGANSLASSGASVTTGSNDLIFAASTVETGVTGAGVGFTNRVVTLPNSDNAEDKIVTAPGSYSATAPVGPAGFWVMQMVAFSAPPGVVTPSPDKVGQWSPPLNWPIVSVHMALLPNGKILASDGQIFAGHDARVWDSVTGIFTPVAVSDNIFCSGMADMPDGRIFVAGGHVDIHTGLITANMFDPVAQTWSSAAPMTQPRWYPTVTSLPDGRMLVTAGETFCLNCVAAIPEIYNPVSNTWSQLTSASLSLPNYPHMFVLPDGRVVNTSASEAPVPARVLDVQAGTWTVVDPTVVAGGSAVMYRPGKILKNGSSVDPEIRIGAPSAATAYVLDMTQAAPAWRQVPSMANGRAYHINVMLPDGNVMVVGGGTTDKPVDLSGAVLQPELWSPITERFTALPVMPSPRLYHSTALLMPDGRVLVAGGGRSENTPAKTDQPTAAFYSPAYLFKGARPVISSAPASIQYLSNFALATPDAARIASAVLIRLGTVTHAIDMNQRYVPLTFQASAGALTVQAPASANLAPPGAYMLFIVDTNGVPSIAAMVSIH
jgi:chitodextrinase